MAVPDLRMPSFSFMEDEKVDNDVHILSLLNQCAACLDNYRSSSSTLDLDDASFALDEALVMAEDPDVCESPPLARCYLYKGHVLCAMEEYAEARSAYQKAINTPSCNPIDSAASEQAGPLAVQMEQKIRDAKRKGGIWSPSDRPMLPHHPPAVRHTSEYGGARPKEEASPYDFPPVHQVGRHRPVITKSQLQSLLQPQRLVESDGVWTVEGQSTPSHREKSRIGLRCFVQESLARGASDCRTIRLVA
ncbi:hypothetical protein F4818DRAFT_278927 [Hypoxylon cercidicola]|nr:hypothetical protein F4818DRAFT_278927 [Hypoxylon cercidicola]